jgi:hypothetical protein
MKQKDRIILLASTLELGHPDNAGKSLADIVLFLLSRIPEEKRQSARFKMIQKIRTLMPNEIAGKNMPDYSSIGQSISFIKNVLAGHDSGYVMAVLESIIRNLGT